MTRALSLVLAASLTAPASAAVNAGPDGAGRQSLERVADLAAAGQPLSRGYDAAGSPAAGTAVDNSAPLPSGLEGSGAGSGVRYNSIPRPDGSLIRADKEDEAAAKKKEEDAKEKSDFKRAMIGGAAAGMVLAVFGFIFGGPMGALALGAIGFGAFAGITYLNNNPIE
ncbi:MAG: hypothetical protein HYZ75_19795 [Elusimicrobia bacterium]|nr:hypothetical protein [Elusimicrobiota bacterium]